MPDESNTSVQAEISVVDGSTSHLRARRLYRIGIPLERLIPPPGAVERQAERGDAWGAGVDTFGLRNSQLIFQDRERGVLKVEVVADVGSSSAVFADESACGAVECPILREC